MNTTNIWQQFDFSDSKQKSAYDYLIEQSKPFKIATNGELEMTIEFNDAFDADFKPPRHLGYYTLYIVAPKLGNFRRMILQIVADLDTGKFPVDIHSVLDGEDFMQVEEGEFIGKFSQIMSRPRIKGTIETLYRQSKEYDS